MNNSKTALEEITSIVKKIEDERDGATEALKIEQDLNKKLARQLRNKKELNEHVIKVMIWLRNPNSIPRSELKTLHKDGEQIQKESYYPGFQGKWFFDLIFCAAEGRYYDADSHLDCFFEYSDYEIRSDYEEEITKRGF